MQSTRTPKRVCGPRAHLALVADYFYVRAHKVMLSKLRAIATANVFPTICYLLAADFLYAFCLAAGIPPTKTLDPTSGGYLALALFLFMLPEAKKLKFGQVFEYEARVKEIKQEVRDFKEETRATLVAYTSLVSAISNTVSQTINVHLPGQDAVNQAKQDLQQTLTTKPTTDKIEEDVEEFLASAGGDVHYALAKLRMQLERELRRILGRQPSMEKATSEETKFLSTRSLFNQFVQRFPAYDRIRSSFDYVLRVCNAAIHAQLVPEGHAQEALHMGFQILSELRHIEQ
jgi:hypothetical protein